MPNRKNAVIQLRKDKKRAERNLGVKNTLKTARKSFEKVLEAGEKDAVSGELTKLQAVIDKTAKKGVIPQGRASRLKSRYATKANTLSSQG